MSEYPERKPTSKGLLARVKCQQRNARTRERDSLSLSQPRESISVQKSSYVTGSITSQSFPDFLNLSASYQKKAVFVQRQNTSLHSKFRQTALKLTPKGLDYTQIRHLKQQTSPAWRRQPETWDFFRDVIAHVQNVVTWRCPEVENVRTWRFTSRRKPENFMVLFWSF